MNVGKLQAKSVKKQPQSFKRAHPTFDKLPGVVKKDCEGGTQFWVSASNQWPHWKWTRKWSPLYVACVLPNLPHGVSNFFGWSMPINAHVVFLMALVRDAVCTQGAVGGAWRLTLTVSFACTWVCVTDLTLCPEVPSTNVPLHLRSSEFNISVIHPQFT